MFKKEITGGPRLLIRSTHANVVMYGVLESTISEDALREAVLLLSDKHKLLNCHIETGKENKLFYVIDEKLSPEIITSKSENINQTLIEELKHLFDLETGPLIRFILLDQSTLMINCHHAICDGMSLVYLFNDIMKILSGKEVKMEQKDPVFLELDNISQKQGNIITRSLISLVNKNYDKKTISFSDQLYQKLGDDYWKEYIPQIIQFNFSKEETANIISQCKQNNVSVNSGLVTAILYAENQVFERKENSNKVMVTYNLRTHLIDQPGETMGYFVSTLRPSLEYNEEKTFWENAQTFHETINQRLEKDRFNSQVIGLFSPKFLDVMMLNLLGQSEDMLANILIKSAGMYKNYATFTIANLGLIKTDDEAEKPMLKELFGPFALSDAMEKYVSVLTLNDELHFSVCFNENTVNQESILKMKELMLPTFDDSPR